MSARQRRERLARRRTVAQKENRRWNKVSARGTEVVYYAPDNLKTVTQIRSYDNSDDVARDFGGPITSLSAVANDFDLYVDENGDIAARELTTEEIGRRIIEALLINA